MNKLTVFCAMLSFLAPVCASADPDFTEIIDDSTGYLQVAPGVVMIEGTYEVNRLCRINVSDEDFETYLKDGALEPSSDRIICIPIEEL